MSRSARKAAGKTAAKAAGKAAKKTEQGAPILSCSGLHRSFAEKSGTIEVLSDISLELAVGERVAIQGASGAGKTALLNLLAGLDEPTAGEVIVMNKRLQEFSQSELVRWRAQYLGFVYQFSHLLTQLTALENVLLPQWIIGIAAAKAARRAEDLLAKVEMTGRAHTLAHHLSGGERQRVAVARAVACSPACLLMDEPTGSLDAASARAVRRLITQLAAEENIAVLLATHDRELASDMDRCLHLEHGALRPAG